jgi:hypothetical protein
MLGLYGLACRERLSPISGTRRGKCKFYTSHSFVPNYRSRVHELTGSGVTSYHVGNLYNRSPANSNRKDRRFRRACEMPSTTKGSLERMAAPNAPRASSAATLPLPDQRASTSASSTMIATALTPAAAIEHRSAGANRCAQFYAARRRAMKPSMPSPVNSSTRVAGSGTGPPAVTVRAAIYSSSAAIVGEIPSE